MGSLRHAANRCVATRRAQTLPGVKQASVPALQIGAFEPDLPLAGFSFQLGPRKSHIQRSASRIVGRKEPGFDG